MTEICFVLAPRQNRFFVEVAEALRFELGRLGVSSEISRDGFPPLRDGLVYALVPPHEFRGLAPPSQWPTPRQLERTLFYCFEQPGTSFFDNDVEMGKGPVGAVLDLNPTSVEELRRRGVAAHHAPVGWTPAWSHAGAEQEASAVEPPPGGDPPSDGRPARDIDILHLGIYSPRRGETLARSAHLLARRRTRLVLGDDHGPNPGPQANFAVGQEKWELLARSRVLLNIHLGDRRYFEWLRVVQAICNGTFVVSEHSTATAPLRPGEHFASARPEALVLLAERYLDDEALRAASSATALAFLRDELPLSATAATVAELAADVDRRCAARRAGEPDRSRADRDAVVDWPDNSAWRDPPPPPPPADGGVDGHAGDAAGSLPPTAGSPPAPPGLAPPAFEVVRRTTAHRAPAPRVSVVTALRDDPSAVEPTLDSAAAARAIDVELIVASERPDREALPTAEGWLRAHDDVPALLLRPPADLGPGPARDAAIDFARGELTLVLDAGATVFPAGVARLAAALDASPETAFAWGIEQTRSADGAPPRLLGVFPWQPWRLVEADYIGRTALWRTADLRALRSATAHAQRREWDPSLLYRLAAKRGMAGAHVPEIVSASPAGSDDAE